MHAVLMAGESWLNRELALLRQLVVGLIDEMVRVSQVVPPSFPDDELVSFGPRLGFQPLSRWVWGGRRVARLVDALEPNEPDLIHGLDGQTWETAALLSLELDIPLALSISRFDELRLLRSVIRRVDPSRLLLLPASNGLGRAVAELVPAAAKTVVCMPGVLNSRDQERKPDREPGESWCGLVSTDGDFDAAYAGFLEGVAEVVGEGRQVQLFIDAPSAVQHAIWRRARRLNLLRNLTMIDQRTARMQVLSGLDALLLPQANGYCRSLTFRAMAAEMTVLAIEDPANDYLIDDQTAWMLKQSDAAHWKSLLLRFQDEPGRARQIAEAGRQWASEHARPSAYILGHLKAYQQLTAESIPFESAPSSEQSPG